MVDPQNITEYNRSDSELQEFILFSVAVAGKTASQISAAVNRFLELERTDASPFEKILQMKKLGCLGMNIREAKLGKWGLLSKCYDQLASSDIDLRTCTTEELEEFPGIGPKTSRFFIMHSRPDQKIAALDTHILSYLRDEGYEVPKITPTGKRYAEVERIFIDHAEKIGRANDIAEFDLEIWNAYSSRSGTGVSIKQEQN